MSFFKVFMAPFWTFLLFAEWSLIASGLIQDNGIPVSDEDLDEFLSQLYLDDDQKPSKLDVTVNFQQRANDKNSTDLAPEKLFTWVSPGLLAKPLYSKLIALFDNYIEDTGSHEQWTKKKDQEIDTFLNEALKTTVFNNTYVFLHERGYPQASSWLQFRNSIRNVWFDTYSRRRKGSVEDSSPFEHVFVGEVVNRRRQRKPGGMHNWLRFYTLERRDEVNYAGYIVKRQNLANIRYRWRDLWEPIGGFMLGTSPAFDLAAYTVCFWMRPKNRVSCKFHMNECATRINNYVMQRNGVVVIGTTFPSPGKASMACKLNSE